MVTTRGGTKMNLWKVCTTHKKIAFSLNIKLPSTVDNRCHYEGCYNISISIGFVSDSFKKYHIAGIIYFSGIRYCTADSVLAGLVRYQYVVALV